MGGIFSEEEQYKPKYNPNDYTKRRPGRNVYKIDKDKVYWRGEQVDGANGKEFSDICGGYGKDSKYVFYKGFKLKTKGPRHFQVLADKYAKDALNVFYRGKVIYAADTDSFKVDTNGAAHDKNYNYTNGLKKSIRTAHRSRGRKKKRKKRSKKK